LTPNGRLEKQTLRYALGMSVSCHNRKSRSTFLIEVGLEQVNP
jgi:hypothetical protein